MEVLLLASLAMAPAIAATAAPAAAATGAPAASGHWLRLERRIESGYFQQNTAALRALSVNLAAHDGALAGGAEARWRDYYGALLAYRLALLAQGDAGRAWPFARQCVTRLDRVLVIDNDSAEALALQSACLALQSRLDPWRSPLAAPLSLARSDKAFALAPDNPRVLLLGALAARDRPRLFGGDTGQAFVMLQRSVAAFERRGPRPRHLPAWGAAEAFTDLARDYLTRGRGLAARNVLERALLVAPDFAQARQLMARIVSG